MILIYSCMDPEVQYETTEKTLAWAGGRWWNQIHANQSKCGSMYFHSLSRFFLCLLTTTLGL